MSDPPGDPVSLLSSVQYPGLAYHMAVRLQERNAKSENLDEVREKIYKAASIINFDGKYYRKDIGLI